MQQPTERPPSKPNGARRFQPIEKEQQNDKLMVHVANIPPMMPDDVVKQAATQFGPVKDFFKVNRYYEKAYEYAPIFGFLTFKEESAVTRALQAGSMSIGETRLSLNPRRPKTEYRAQNQGRLGGEFRGNNLPQGPVILPERPPPVRNPGSFHAKKQSNGSQTDNRGNGYFPHKGPRNSSSTCTVYGLPEKFVNQDLTERGNAFGRVINAHIFEYKDREGRRFGTLNFDSSTGAEAFYKKENGQMWNDSSIKITFEPFNVAKRNNAPPFRPGNCGPQNFQRHEQRTFDGQKRYQNGNRGQRYPPNGQGRFNQRGSFSQNGNFNGPPHFQMQPQYPVEPQYYDPQMMGYQYQSQYPPVMSVPHMAGQPQYGPVGVSPPLGYGQTVPSMPGPYQSPPPMQHAEHAAAMHGGSQMSYSNTSNYSQRYDGYKNITVNESPKSKSSVSNDTAGIRKVSGETSITVPTQGLENETLTKTSVSAGRHPVVIQSGHYLQAQYAYEHQMLENVHPASTPITQQQLQAVENAPAEADVPVTVPETKDPEDPCNIFIKNIDDDVISKPEHLEAYCKKFGDIVSISLPTYENGIIIKGFGFVKFTVPEAALKAKEELNLQIIGRKRLFVSFAETGDHRHSRLARFYDQGAREGVMKSPPDPLIPRTAETSKKVDDSDEEGSEVRDETVVSAMDGDATLDTPAEKVVKSSNTKNDEEAFEKNETTTTSSVELESPVSEIDFKKAPAVEISGTASQTKQNDEKERKETKIIKAVKSRKLSAEGLKELDPAIQFITKKPTSDSKKGRKLSAEDLKKLDPAIQSIGRQESTDPAILSSGAPSPPNNATPDKFSTALKAERLKQLLQGLQTSDLRSFSSSSSGGEVPKKKLRDTYIKGGVESSFEDQNTRLKEGILKALGGSVEKPAGEKATGEKSPGENSPTGGSPSKIPSRSDTRNSTSSLGSRVSREEFSEALKEKFGDKVPATIRATDVLEAVDNFVDSRNATRGPSPSNKIGETKSTNEKATKQRRGGISHGTSNIVAPAPSRKVSVQRITPFDVATEEPATVQETKIGKVDKSKATMTTLEKNHTASAANDEVKSDLAKQQPSTPLGSTKAVDDASRLAETPQNITVLDSDDQKGRYIENSGAANPRRSCGPSGQSKQPCGNNTNYRKYPRNGNLNQGDPTYRQGSNHGGMFSPPYPPNFQRGTEQIQNFPQFPTHPNERYGSGAVMDFGNLGPHPPTMICDGPPSCNQLQCQPPFTRCHPPEMQYGMFPSHMPGMMAQMPFYDPAMFHGRPYYGMDNAPPPLPHMYNGAHGMYPHPQQWGQNSNGHPNTAPQPQGSFPMIAPGPRYSPPHGQYNSSHMVGTEHSNQNRGTHDYGQYPPQPYCNSMYHEQGMISGAVPPQQYPGQGQYRPPQGGVTTF
ncbi:hypothetical protein ABW20_dc0101409 [Dactylellina cionopaga]|nr:hypothetical protein ABW20_dc0101409 [Dactylellina cionopaga]